MQLDRCPAASVDPCHESPSTARSHTVTTRDHARPGNGYPHSWTEADGAAPRPRLPPSRAAESEVAKFRESRSRGSATRGTPAMDPGVARLGQAPRTAVGLPTRARRGPAAHLRGEP